MAALKALSPANVGTVARPHARPLEPMALRFACPALRNFWPQTCSDIVKNQFHRIDLKK